MFESTFQGSTDEILNFSMTANQQGISSPLFKIYKDDHSISHLQHT